MYLQRDEAEAANKMLTRKQRTNTPKSFIVAREAVRWDRDRQRREIHNKIEKRRRSFINAKIAELGNLLPEHIDRTSCNRKGAILTETVEYMKQLQSDQELLKQLESKISYLSIETMRMAERLKFLEMQPVPSPTHNCHDKMEAKTVFRYEQQTKIPESSQSKCEEISGSRCNKFTPDMMAPFTQSEMVDDESGSMSSLLRDNSMIYFEDSATFSDLLSDYF